MPRKKEQEEQEDKMPDVKKYFREELNPNIASFSFFDLLIKYFDYYSTDEDKEEEQIKNNISEYSTYVRTKYDIETFYLSPDLSREYLYFIYAVYVFSNMTVNILNDKTGKIEKTLSKNEYKKRLEYIFEDSILDYKQLLEFVKETFQNYNELSNDEYLKLFDKVQTISDMIYILIQPERYDYRKIFTSYIDELLVKYDIYLEMDYINTLPFNETYKTYLEELKKHRETHKLIIKEEEEDEEEEGDEVEDEILKMSVNKNTDKLLTIYRVVSDYLEETSLPEKIKKKIDYFVTEKIDTIFAEPYYANEFVKFFTKDKYNLSKLFRQYKITSDDEDKVMAYFMMLLQIFYVFLILQSELFLDWRKNTKTNEIYNKFRDDLPEVLLDTIAYNLMLVAKKPLFDTNDPNMVMADKIFRKVIMTGTTSIAFKPTNHFYITLERLLRQQVSERNLLKSAFAFIYEKLKKYKESDVVTFSLHKQTEEEVEKEQAVENKELGTKDKKDFLKWLQNYFAKHKIKGYLIAVNDYANGKLPISKGGNIMEETFKDGGDAYDEDILAKEYPEILFTLFDALWLKEDEPYDTIAEYAIKKAKLYIKKQERIGGIFNFIKHVTKEVFDDEFANEIFYEIPPSENGLISGTRRDIYDIIGKIAEYSYEYGIDEILFDFFIPKIASYEYLYLLLNTDHLDYLVWYKDNVDANLDIYDDSKLPKIKTKPTKISPFSTLSFKNETLSEKSSDTSSIISYAKKSFSEISDNTTLISISELYKDPDFDIADDASPSEIERVDDVKNIYILTENAIDFYKELIKVNSETLEIADVIFSKFIQKLEEADDIYTDILNSFFKYLIKCTYFYVYKGLKQIPTFRHVKSENLTLKEKNKIIDSQLNTLFMGLMSNLRINKYQVQGKKTKGTTVNNLIRVLAVEEEGRIFREAFVDFASKHLEDMEPISQ